METKKLTPEQLAALKAPLPKEAIKQHPTKPYLSSIKVIYMVERLNDVFGLGGWFVNNEVIEATEDMVVIKATFTAPEFGILVENFGGNDNSDRGDAYKGACTDALSKICSYLYVGMDVYKGHDEPARTAPPRRQAAPAAPATKGPVPQPPPNQAQAVDFLDVNISEVTSDIVATGKRKGQEYVWVKDGPVKSWPCFDAKLFDQLRGQRGENIRVKLAQGTKGKYIVGIVSDADDGLGITNADLPEVLRP